MEVIIINNNGTGALPPELEEFRNVNLTFVSTYKGVMNYRGFTKNKELYVSFEVEYKDDFTSTETMGANDYNEFNVQIKDKKLCCKSPNIVIQEKKSDILMVDSEENGSCYSDIYVDYCSNCGHVIDVSEG